MTRQQQLARERKAKRRRDRKARASSRLRPIDTTVVIGYGLSNKTTTEAAADIVRQVLAAGGEFHLSPCGCLEAHQTPRYLLDAVDVFPFAVRDYLRLHPEYVAASAHECEIHDA